MPRTAINRLRDVFRKRTREQELDEEIRLHLELATEENIRRGMDPQEARRAARRSFGIIDPIKEEYGDGLGIPFLESLIRDVIFAFRAFRKDPVFTLTALATIGLGIGVTAAVFTVAKAALIRPLPYASPDRLVMLWNVNEKTGVTVEQQRLIGRSLSPREYVEWRDHSGIFEELAAVHREPRGHLSRADRVLSLDADANGEVSTLAFATPNFFRTLGVQPFLGRTFEDGSPGVILKYNYWRSRFGADPGIVGTSVWMGAGGDGSEQWNIVGVMPPRFEFYSRQIDFLTLLDADRAAARKQFAYERWWVVVGRLRPGLTVREAQSRADTFSSRMAADDPEHNQDWHVRLVPAVEDSTGEFRPALIMLLGAVGCVLLIVCTNVASFLLVKATARGKEIALRNALGASRPRLVRQLLTESTVLGLTGGVLGLWFAQGLVDYLRALIPNRHAWGKFLLQGESIGVDGWVVGFALLSAVAVGILFGMIPAFRVSKPKLSEALKDAGAGSVGGRRGQRLRHVLVFVEVTLAVVLVAGAGLLVRSFLGLYGHGPGFGHEQRLVFSVRPTNEHLEQSANKLGGHANEPLEGGSDLFWAAKDLFREDVLRYVASLTGVVGVTSASRAPMEAGYDRWTFLPESATSAGSRTAYGILTAVQQNYFREMEIPIAAGRGFDVSDRSGSTPVAVVSRELANRLWPGEDPIGRRVKTGGTQAPSPWLTVVGVAGDVYEDGIDKPAQAHLYHPWTQYRWWWGGVSVVVHASREPWALLPEIRRIVTELDSGAEVRSVYGLDDLVRDSAWRLNYSTLMLGGLAGLSLLLAAVGVYGVLSQTVRERTREIGLRMAMGAGRREVLQMILKTALGPVLLGIAVGLMLASGLTRFLGSLLYGVQPLDTLTFVCVALVLTAAALLASYFPARRAAKIDPMVALRYE